MRDEMKDDADDTGLNNYRQVGGVGVQVAADTVKGRGGDGWVDGWMDVYV